MPDDRARPTVPRPTAAPKRAAPDPAEPRSAAPERAAPSAAITRRSLLGAAAAAGASAALPGIAPGATPRPPRKADVIVVGAGLAGLSAARELVRKGRSVVVLEARDRVGGRTLNHDLGKGQVVEIGGQWVGPTQDRIVALAKQVGIGTFKTYNEGTSIALFEGTKIEYPAAIGFPTLPDDALTEFIGALGALDALAKDVPRAKPWTAKAAEALDAQTFQTWIDAHATKAGTRWGLELAFEAIWAAEPRDVSLLHALFYIAAAGNAKTPGSLIRLSSTGGGAQESRLVGGSQKVSIEVARRLGRRVVLGAPVRRIAKSGSTYVATSDKGDWTAKHVIVALPPVLAGRIDYRPHLPAHRDHLTQRYPAGSVIKTLAIYDAPWWRKDGLSGQGLADTGPVRVIYDNTPPSGTPGILLGFIEGDQARTWSRRSAKDRRAAVLDSLAGVFGDRARAVKDYAELDWSAAQWTRGCYAGYLPPGVLTAYGDAIRAPVGRIHWAGTETATEWNGYMDGAVQSGQRAAREVLAG